MLFGGMKNKTKLNSSIALFPVVWAVRETGVFLCLNISDKTCSMEQSSRKSFAASSLLQHMARNIASLAP